MILAVVCTLCWGVCCLFCSSTPTTDRTKIRGKPQ
jgi:hypothetical protein